jgi:hypothetical protein
MPDVLNLAKAELQELDANLKITTDKTNWTKVQFNPDSLKVSFANQVAPAPGAGDKSGPQALQFVGAGTTKLAVTLSFDVTSEIPPGLPDTNDVRQLTQRVAYFITPVPQPKTGTPKSYIVPGVRFTWGSFQFDGVMESMEETLELFSFEGRPLRATVAIAVTQQKITAFTFNNIQAPPPVTRQGGQAPGTSPLTEASAGASLQGLAAQGGLSGSADWQSIATANGIENPRLLKPGQLIDLNPPSASLQLG